MTAPLRRRGPRPLPLHLGLAGIRALAAGGMLPGMPWPSGLPPWSAGWPISKAGQAELARISAALASAGHAPEAFRSAVLNRLLRADRALVSGLAAYRRHPFQRVTAPMPAIWAEEDTKLLDYGGKGPYGGNSTNAFTNSPLGTIVGNISNAFTTPKHKKK